MLNKIQLRKHSQKCSRIKKKKKKQKRNNDNNTQKELEAEQHFIS